MNKNTLIKTSILLATILTLISCNGTNNNSSKSSLSNNSSTSSLRVPASNSTISSSVNNGSAVKPEDYTMTISDFSYFLQNTSYDLEANETTSSIRKITQVEQQAYAIETKIVEEKLSAYEGPYVVVDGTENITYKSTDSILDDDYEGFQPKSDTYTTFRGVYEGMYYEIDDYGQGKERDYAGKFEINKDVMENELSWNTSTQVSYFVDYYLFDLFGLYLTDYYELEANYDPETNGVEYFVEYSYPTQDTYGIVYSSAELYFSMDLDGFVTSYVYRYSEKARDYDESGNLGQEYLVYSIIDECEVQRGNRKEALDDLPIIPTDYWVQTFDIQIVASNVSLDEEKAVPNDQIPAKYYIEAVATNIYPEKALDVNLIILSSSDNEVIEVNPYGVVKSLKGGNTTLTIQSIGGIEKTLDVTVFEEAISKIEVKLYSSHFYVGETYGIYEYITPENAIDSIVWSIDNPEIASITVDSRGYASLVCHTVGTVIITATSVKNPEVIGTTTITITEKQNEETLKSIVTAQEWKNIETPEDVIVFNEDGTGSVTFVDLLTEETITADFEWMFTEYSEEEGLLIAITSMIDTYDANFCILSLNGLTLEVSFFHQDPELWFYQYVGDFAQQAN